MGRHAVTAGLTPDVELVFMRQVFETWWIAVPPDFEERWVADGGYWHARNERSSISLSSTVLTDGDRPVTAAEMLEQFGDVMLDGEPIEDMAPGLQGRATIIEIDGGSRALTGFVAVEGRVLIATITSDDLAWARRTWTSIGYRPAPVPNRAARRAEMRGRGRLD